MTRIKFQKNQKISINHRKYIITYENGLMKTNFVSDLHKGLHLARIPTISRGITLPSCLENEAGCEVNMEKTIFGYYIGKDVHLDIQNRTLINVNKNLSSRLKTQVFLRDTMLRLLTFLLDNADGNIIDNTEILINVWEAHGLSSSNQRLWQVMLGLRKKLNDVGIPDDFIMRVESKGYYVRESMVTILYSENKTSRVASLTSDVHHDIHHF